MDAVTDQDLRLQRNSADLLADLETSVSRCLWEPGSEHKARQVIDRRQLDRLVGLVADLDIFLFFSADHRERPLA